MPPIHVRSRIVTLLRVLLLVLVVVVAVLVAVVAVLATIVAVLVAIVAVLVAIIAVLVVIIIVLVTVAGSGATKPVIGEGEHHMQLVVFRRLYDVIKANEAVLPLIDLDGAVLVKDLEPHAAFFRNFGNIVEGP